MANSNELKRYHYVYQTTNLLNGTYYIGVHSTNNLNDGYLGSGKRLKRSVNKYGKENFKLTILESFDSRKSLFEKEKELVNEELLKDPKCINLKPGGSGGLMNEEHGKKFRELGNEKHHYKLKNDPIYKKMLGDKISKKLIDRHKNGEYDVIVDNLKKIWIGKKHKLETIEKLKKIKKNFGVGETNSQFGTCWITNGIENKKIKKENMLPNGWKFGRT